MKRSFVLLLAASLAVILPAGLACAQSFSNMTLAVPSGWYASETNTEVTLINGSDTRDFMLLQLFYMGSSTLQSVANTWYEGLGGTGDINHDEEGRYSFWITSSNGARFQVLLEDNSYSSRIPQDCGFIAVMAASSGNTAGSVFFNDIYDTLTFSLSNNGGDAISGDVQTFSRMSFFVPDGWTPEETDGGKSVAVYRDNSNREAFIKFDVDAMDGRSLEDIANSLYETLNGRDLQRSSYGFYSFYFTDASGVSSTAFVDDSSTDSGVPGGYYWAQFVSTKADAGVWQKVINSFRITIGDTGGSYEDDDFGRGDSGTGEAAANAKGGIFNNHEITSIINENNGDNSGSQDSQTDGEQQVSGGGSSGGCSAGSGSLALLALCSAFIVRKSR